MNLVWHIVKKDFIRLRLPLLLWTGLLLGGIFVSERMFSASNLEPEWFGHQAGTLGVITFVWVVVGYILAGALGLEDTLVGSQIFWVTRPISGGRLLAAKLLGAALFFILWPVLVATLWWLWCGLGLSDIGHGAGQVMVQQVLLVLPALALAALAGQNSRFLLWTLGTLLAVLFGTGMVAYYLPKDLPPELFESRMILAYGIGLLTCGAVIWLQYRSRRLARSIIVTAAAAVLALLIGFCWRWDVTWLRPKDTRQLAGTEKISVTFGEATLEIKDSRSWVNLMFAAKDVPAEWTILSGEAQMEFRWPDGTTLQHRGRVEPVNPDYTARSLLNLPPVVIDSATEMKHKEEAEAARQRMIERGLHPKPPLPKGTNLITYAEGIPADLVAKFATPPAVRVSLRLRVGRAELLAETPLKEGAGQTGNGVRLRVLKLEPAAPDKPANQMSAIIVTSQPARMQFLQFLLVDRAHGTVTMEPAAAASSFRVSVLPMLINRSLLHLNIPQLWRGDKWVGAPEWLEQDTLAAVTYRPDGGFDRELQADRLVFVRK